MTISLKFYADAALTTELTGLSYVRAADGSSGNDDRVVYLGSTVSSKTFTPVSGSNITVSVADSATGAGVPATAVRLATTQAGLAAATPGAALTLPASMTSGPANALPVWVRLLTGALVAGSYTDISLTTNNLAET